MSSLRRYDTEAVEVTDHARDQVAERAQHRPDPNLSELWRELAVVSSSPRRDDG